MVHGESGVIIILPASVGMMIHLIIVYMNTHTNCSAWNMVSKWRQEARKLQF